MAPQKGVETNAPKHEFAFHTVSSLLGVSARAGCQSDSKREFQSELCSENPQVMGKVKQSCETCNTKDHVPANKAPLFCPRSEVVGRNVAKGKPPFDGLAMEFARRRVLTPSNKCRVLNRLFEQTPRVDRPPPTLFYRSRGLACHSGPALGMSEFGGKQQMQ